VFDDWIPLVERFGVPVTMLLVVVLTGARKWWAYGWYVAAVERDRDFWRGLALQGTALAERQQDLTRDAIRVSQQMAHNDRLAP
jgi:hypothetical protein